MSQVPAVLAVDGGNSKTDVWAVAADGALLTTIRGPGFRPKHTGARRALADLSATIRAALPTGPPHEADGRAAIIIACMANVDLPEEEERVHTAVTSLRLGDRVEVRNDTFALLRAGASQGWGVAVVCGAGINCAAVAPDGRETRFPALGELTGDWGGGWQLARAALWWAVRAEDGRGPATALRTAVAGHFGHDTATDVALAVHREIIPESRLDELTPVLLRVAGAGDTVATRVVDRLAEEITTLGTVALRRLDLLDEPAEVVLGGGVLAARDPGLLAAIERRFASAAPAAKLTVVDAPPVLGAALHGLDRITAPGEAGERLRGYASESR